VCLRGHSDRRAERQNEVSEGGEGERRKREGKKGERKSESRAATMRRLDEG
jgi:hypothetical protein